MVRNQGYSLVELMIGIAIGCLLLLSAGTLSGYWLSSNKLKKDQTLLLQAAARAKSLAYRNSSGAASSGAAAYLLLTSNSLCVINGNASSFSCANPVWSSALSTTQAQINSSSTACIAYNNAGLPIAVSLGTQTCTTDTRYLLAIDTQQVTGNVE